MLLLLISVFVALLISGFCSLMEAVLLSLTPGQVAEISARRPWIGSIWQQFKDDIERPIAAILILNTAAHTIGASIAGAEFDAQFGNDWIWAFSLVFTFLMLQFTEIMPKGLGVRYNRRIAHWIAQPLAFLTRILMPLVRFVHWINRPIGNGRRQPHASSSSAPASLPSIQVGGTGSELVTAGAWYTRPAGRAVGGRIFPPPGIAVAVSCHRFAT